jgi:hypothetical protein
MYCCCLLIIGSLIFYKFCVFDDRPKFGLRVPLHIVIIILYLSLVIDPVLAYAQKSYTKIDNTVFLNDLSYLLQWCLLFLALI